MKYNCLRTTPYAKMFVVGLLLYLGETVFFKCSEDTFTVEVITLTNVIIKVHNCKETDKLSEFMKKFEDAYEKKINDGKIKGIKYNLRYRGKPLVKARIPVEDKLLADLGFNKYSVLFFANPLKVFKTVKIKRSESTDRIRSRSYKNFQNEFLINPQNKEKYSIYENEDKNLLSSGNINRSRSFQKLLPTNNTDEEEGSSTSTCPLRRCCRICGC